MGISFNSPKGRSRWPDRSRQSTKPFVMDPYGFLFHMEVTQKIIGEMVETFSEELKECRIDRREIVGKVDDHLPRLQKIGGVVFERWAKFIPK